MKATSRERAMNLGDVEKRPLSTVRRR